MSEQNQLIEEKGEVKDFQVAEKFVDVLGFVLGSGKVNILGEELAYNVAGNNLYLNGCTVRFEGNETPQEKTKKIAKLLTDIRTGNVTEYTAEDIKENVSIIAKKYIQFCKKNPVEGEKYDSMHLVKFLNNLEYCEKTGTKKTSRKPMSEEHKEAIKKAKALKKQEAQAQEAQAQEAQAQEAQAQEAQN